VGHAENHLRAVNGKVPVVSFPRNRQKEILLRSSDEIDAEDYEECAANRIDNISDQILIEESG